MFQRYVTCDHAGGRCSRQGIFRGFDSAVRRFRDGRRADELAELLDWFNLHLKIPPRDVFRGSVGVCWFRSESLEIRDRLWSWVVLLRSEGIRIHQVTSRDPGVFTYHDEHQVVAIPYAVAWWAR